MRGTSSRQKRQHKDPKQVFEGLEGLSVCCALGYADQVARRLTELNPNKRDLDGDRVPLHWAAARGELQCIQLLLAAGADASLLDAQGNTAAALALAADQKMAFNLLTFGESRKDSKEVYEGIQSLSLHTAPCRRSRPLAFASWSPLAGAHAGSIIPAWTYAVFGSGSAIFGTAAPSPSHPQTYHWGLSPIPVDTNMAH